MVKVNKWSFKAISMFSGDYIGLIGSQLTAEIFTLMIYLPALWFISKWSFEYFEMYFIKLKYKIK
jgi:hypothetical protein